MLNIRFSFIATFSVINFSLCAATAENLTVLADPWCPFTCATASPKPGVLIEVLRAALGPKIVVDYKEVAWSRAVNETRNGNFSALAGALKADAPGFIFSQSSLAHQKSCFYVTQDSTWTFKNVSSLKDKLLGGVSEYTYGEPLDAYIKEAGADSKKIDFITGVNTSERLIRKLNDKRIDVLVEDSSVVDYHFSTNAELKKMGIKQAGCLQSQPLYIAFSPAAALKTKSKEYAALLDAGLKRIKASGELNKIFSSYGLKSP